MTKHIAIIGNGVAGITAARFIRKLSDHRVSVISDETDHFYSRTALMYVYMGHMTYEDTKPYEDWFWKKNRIDLIRDYVVRVDTAARTLHFAGRSPMKYDALIIATGSASSKLGWPGQDLPGVQGLYGVQDLHEMERWTEGIDRAVVVGGGLIGIEMAEMLHSRHIPVTFVVRENGYMDYLLPREESEMINREIREHDIDLRLGSEIEALEAGDDGRVSHARLKDGASVDCGFVGLTVGVHPRIDFLKGSDIETDRGVLVDLYFRTNVADVYAAGDCVQFRDSAVAHRPIEQLWYTGRKHGKTVAHNVCGTPTPYDRGLFYNSAKFFTIEYQTYGDIRSATPDRHETVVWQSDDGKRLLRINYDRTNSAVVGFNAMGVRLRQDRCEQLILQKASIDTVLGSLASINFDPEMQKGSVPVNGRMLVAASSNVL